jgi:hypothetical protein
MAGRATLHEGVVMKKIVNVFLMLVALVQSSPVQAQFLPAMSAEALEQELSAQLATKPLADTIRAMLEAGLEVEVILTSLVSLSGQPGYGAVSLESIVEAAIVAGLPPPTVVAVLINVVDTVLGNIAAAQIEAIIASAVAADVLVNGSKADVLAIAQAAADTGKISFPEASAIARVTVVAVLRLGDAAPVDAIEPVISAR